MGLLLMVAIISGVVLYAPFMRKLRFGEVRQERTARTRWLDLHNLLGIVTLVWALAVGFTGVINTWADLIFQAWQAEQVAALQAGKTRVLLPKDASDAPAADGSLQTAVDRVLAAAPGMAVAMIAYPGTLRATPEHVAVMLHGDTPLTSRLSQALLVDPANGEVLEASARPWYVTALQLSEPLHFGDYGGLPLKVLWALLDILTIVVLGSGLYLWLARRDRGADMMRIWLWPVVIAVLSAAGLIAGLVSEGAGDWLSWLALAAPVAVGVHGLTRCGAGLRRAATISGAQHLGELIEAERLG